MTPYDDCVYCGGSVQEEQITIDYRHHGQLFIMEGVRAGVCVQCGERFLTAETAKRLEQASQRQSAPVTMVAIPLLRPT